MTTVDPARAKLIESVIHRAPSVGSVTKRMLEINPDLTVQQTLEIVRQSIHRQGEHAGEFASIDIIDEAQALQLARETVGQSGQAGGLTANVRAGQASTAQKNRNGTAK